MESAALSAIMAFISESIPVRLSPQELRHAMQWPSQPKLYSFIYAEKIRFGPAYRKSRL